MLFYPRQQRERKRQNSDRSEEGYHSDGDYPEQDYREEPGEEKESKTIMLRGLSLHITEGDVSFSALHSRPVCHVVWLAASCGWLSVVGSLSCGFLCDEVGALLYSLLCKE